MGVITGKFPQESNWQKWLIADEGANLDLEPTFRERLAAYTRDVLKRQLHILAGFRSYEQQAYLYQLYRSGKGNFANPPGTSWHEFHNAIDIHGPNSLWPEVMADYSKPPLSQAMTKYGLFIKSWVGATGVHEWWHIMPLEILNYTGTKETFLEDTMQKGDNGTHVLAWQNALVDMGFPMIASDGKINVPNGNFGPATEASTNRFKLSVGLKQDGIVDSVTFGKMLDAIRAKEHGIINTQASQITDYKTRLDKATTTIAAVKTAIG